MVSKGPAFGQGHGRKNIRRWGTKRSRREHVVRHMIWARAQSMKVYVSYVGIHQTVSITEKAISNQVDKIARPVDACQPLSSAIPVPAFGHSGKDGGKYLGQYHGLSLTKTNLTTGHSL